VERWIFTAAHELGHLLLHLVAFDVAQAEENDREEKEADLFAGHLLMPDVLFKKELAEAWGLSWFDRVFKLKRQFRVSYRSVLHRIASGLPDDQRRTVWIRFNVEYRRRTGRPLPGTIEPEGLPPEAFFRRPPDKGADEPERLERHGFMQDRLARLVRQALEKKVITIKRAAELLDVGAGEMLDLAESWIE
jgi:Zn-dependent peptidase ImmA (M78 family)